MAEYFEINDQVLEIAKNLIEQYHVPLQDAKIGFVFRDEAPTSNGKTVLGKAQKADKKLTPFLETPLDFLIWVAFDTWQNLSPSQQIALVDHELCHCKYDDIEQKASLRPHDVEEFREIIERHGLWSLGLQTVAPAMEKALQMTMPGIPKRGEVVKVKQFEMEEAHAT